MKVARRVSYAFKKFLVPGSALCSVIANQFVEVARRVSYAFKKFLHYSSCCAFLQLTKSSDSHVILCDAHVAQLYTGHQLIIS